MGTPCPLHVYSAGFLSPRLRRILSLAGYPPRFGLPSSDGIVGVWGASPTAWRGKAIARRRGASLLRIEDAFLRSLHPGRAGEPPLGLLLDKTGVHFDARAPSDLETLLRDHPLDDPRLLDRAEEGIARLREDHLTKYAAVDPNAPLPASGYILIVDQARGDASLQACGADQARFETMLETARSENPGKPLLVRSHPETALGYRSGHLAPTKSLPAHLSPWTLLDHAEKVYTVSSQLGFEAILSGHRPVVFGQPFYAGWGLSDDRMPPLRRGRTLTSRQLFAAAMLLYPTWYDPCRDRLCSFEDALDHLAAQSRAWREDRHGWIAGGMRRWKRPALRRFFGQHGGITFTERAKPRAEGPRPMVWASRSDGVGDVTRIEDGFLRSRGLGAALVPPLSLVADDRGIYYDPTRPSRLDEVITRREVLRPGQVNRAERLIERIAEAGLSKYNLGGALPDLPSGRRILVPGQVEDDASILLGAGETNSYAALLARARAANPGAVLIYKPHPDVEAGLRRGALDGVGIADVIAHQSDPISLLSMVDEVWTMTSLLGFEALLRGVPVTVTGQPFYAGWGLTRDLGPPVPHRTARPTLAGLVHAALIDYPRYLDPVSGLPCPVEVIVDRLIHNETRPRSFGLGLASVVQVAFKRP
ncbi:capsular polysaccharide export protein [Poseidonocella pacifica]|uniref:Capsular polysaccharide export protein n=1 Tax=Poseidonocella pacifica TaxID=871651 RepID=A0A1I0V5V4_9RHOB|nr:capsular polysaccharide biosynthesis protein [Poseidonocella pacifica]SFA71632.1 capsular polysaccharide export protein [Poseidonocella pacifica]